MRGSRGAPRARKGGGEGVPPARYAAPPPSTVRAPRDDTRRAAHLERRRGAPSCCGSALRDVRREALREGARRGELSDRAGAREVHERRARRGGAPNGGTTRVGGAARAPQTSRARVEPPRCRPRASQRVSPDEWSRDAKKTSEGRARGRVLKPTPSCPVARLVGLRDVLRGRCQRASAPHTQWKRSRPLLNLPHSGALVHRHAAGGGGEGELQARRGPRAPRSPS